MRLFVAVNLPPAERQRLFDAAAPLRTGGFPFRWVMPDAMHVTLRFLGHVDAARVDRIRDALAVAADGHARHPMSISGLGAFPNLRRPRVLWIGADGGTALQALHADVARSLADVGFEPEPRPWSPHVTLGRAKSGTRPASFSGLAAVADSVDFATTVTVESVDLMRSWTGSGPARYERIEGAALGRARTQTRNGQEAAK